MGYELRPTGWPLEVGLQIDTSIDQTLRVPCLEPVLSLLGAYPETTLLRHVRPTRAKLAEALRTGPASDQILFFCCHGQQEGDLTHLSFDEGYLVLSDRGRDPQAVRITPDDIRLWMDMKEFDRRPLVFLNACGAGQLNSIFYSSFGRTFLGLGASSVVGAQTDLPAVFAGEFARRFFAALLKGGPENKVGWVLFRLRRELASCHHNPLGLIYTLYRGADSYLPRAVDED